MQNGSYSFVVPSLVDAEVERAYIMALVGEMVKGFLDSIPGQGYHKSLLEITVEDPV